MNYILHIICSAVLATLLSAAALAQPATRADPPRTHSLELREEDRVALQCDRFAGAAKEQCLLDERRRRTPASGATGLPSH